MASAEGYEGNQQLPLADCVNLGPIVTADQAQLCTVEDLGQEPSMAAAFGLSVVLNPILQVLGICRYLAKR